MREGSGAPGSPGVSANPPLIRLIRKRWSFGGEGGTGGTGGTGGGTGGGGLSGSPGTGKKKKSIRSVGSTSCSVSTIARTIAATLPVTNSIYEGPYVYFPLKCELSRCHCVCAGFSESPSSVAKGPSLTTTSAR